MKKIILIFLIALINKGVDAQTWTPVGTGLQQNYGRIESMCEYNGELYVGGLFDSIGGISVISIARWNGTTWDSVPGVYAISRYLGISSQVEIFDMVVYNGELIVAGITWENGNQLRAIAKWDGTTWSQLGTGVDNRILAVEVYNGELYATGQFEHAGGFPARGIAKWNGTTWSLVGGPGLNTSPGYEGAALQTYNGELYLAGGFNLINGLPVHCITRWNGAVWDSVGTINELWGFQSLGEYNNKLFLGGNMFINNDPGNKFITSWNSTVWDSVGLGLNYLPNSMTVYNNELYVAGQFDTAGGAQALCIARWNDSQWNTVGGGLNLYHINVDSIITPFDTTIYEKEYIYTMCVYNNELYVGGTFTQMGGVNANSIAKWHIVGASVDELNSVLNFSLSPNPFTNVASLNSHLKLEGAQLHIYDVLGHEVRKMKNLYGQHFEIDRKNLTTGIYFISIIQDDKTWTGKLTVE